MNDAHKVLNDLLVHMFNNILRIEEKAITTNQFKDLSINDMHIIEAIDVGEAKTMTAVSVLMKVTVGTLTIAINNLVKKEYVNRERSEEDRRIVLISLTEKGKLAYEHHMAFHQRMIDDVIKKLDKEQIQLLTGILGNLNDYFIQIETENKANYLNKNL